MGRGGRNGLFLPKKGRDWGRWSMIDFFCIEEGGDCRLKFCNYQDGGERGEGRGERRNSDSSRSAFEYLA